MISLVSMMINAVISFFLYILKAVFSMLSWFIKKLFGLFKLFFCALPLTCILFFLLFIANIFFLIAGVQANTTFEKYQNILNYNTDISKSLIDELKIWWVLNVFNYRGSAAFIPLIILSVVMAIPVLTAFLSISVVLSFGHFLFYAVVADMVIYLIRAIFHKSFAAQLLDRYYRLFPDKGKRHYEKSYEKWLRKRHEEFESDDRDYDDHRCDEFYEDSHRRSNRLYNNRSHHDDFYEEDSDEDYYEDEDDEDDDIAESEYYEEDDDSDELDYYEDDEVDDSDDFYGDDRRSGNASKGNVVSAFNFFAGCNSKESVERKYKSLVKLYHPDNMDGDTAALTEINLQYAKTKKRFQY